MNLHRLLRARAEEGRPVGVGLIGCGKFASMFLAQVPRTPGLAVPAIADRDPARAAAMLAKIGWEADRIAPNGAEARPGCTALAEDPAAVASHPEVEVVVEATGDPKAGALHALAAIEAGKHVVMVNVEADALVGPVLADQARRAGVVYSLAYGDQPALICELVDTVRTGGLAVVAAGKGTKYLPAFHASTPQTVWQHYGIDPVAAARGGMNPRMFNSFLDGTKSAIEMAAVANATGLAPPEDGLLFLPCGVDDLPRVLRPRAEGGVLERAGMVEVVSSLERDGRAVHRDLRWGVYVVFEGETDYVRACFAEYGVTTDPAGRYAALYRPFHLIGLELGVSIASVALRREATGFAEAWRADVAAVAKRDLAAGEVLDGEGGFMVWGKCVPAHRAVQERTLPIGLAHGVPLARAVQAGEMLRYGDAVLDETDAVLRLRRALEGGATLGSSAR